MTRTGESPSIAEACLAGLAALGGKTDAETLHGWLAEHGQALTYRQVTTALHRLSIARPPLAECAERAAGRGRPGMWHLTGPGRDKAGLTTGARIPCGTGWPRL